MRIYSSLVLFVWGSSTARERALLAVPSGFLLDYTGTPVLRIATSDQNSRGVVCQCLVRVAELQLLQSPMIGGEYSDAI